LPPLFHYPAPGTVRREVGRPAGLKIMALLRFDRYRQGDLLGWKSQRLAWPVLTDFPPGFPLTFLWDSPAVKEWLGRPVPHWLPHWLSVWGRTGFDRMARGSDCVSWLVGWPR